MADDQLIQLIEKYLAGKATEDEKLQVEAWYEQQANENKHFYNNDAEQIRLAAERSLKAIREKLNEQETPIITMRPRRLSVIIAAAASILIFISVGAYFLLQHNKAPQQVAKNIVPKNDILPGGNKAYLILSNGQRVSLTGAANGTITRHAGITVTKTADGQIVYQADSAAAGAKGAAVAYNTVETPKGGQYQVVLSDGSHVWLNAASSLRYPAQFAANERRVELTGEAYFEVAKDKTRPFRVASNNQIVEVLGTHFNINSYADEPTTLTTLLEGSVKINSNTILKPGEQASLVKNGNVNVKAVDTDEAVAWKNGIFQFDNTGLEAVMRQLARWYDVEIQYDGKVPSRTFTGKIHKDINASDALSILKFTKVNFKIDGKKIIVTQ